MKSIFDIANSLLFKTQSAIDQKKTDSVVQDTPTPTNRILGMPKPLFFTAIGIVAVALTVTTIYFINNLSALTILKSYLSSFQLLNKIEY